MKSKVAQYLNELVSLSILTLMVVALIAGQSAPSRAEHVSAVATESNQDVRPQPLKRVVDASIAPISDVLTYSSQHLADRAGLGIDNRGSKPRLSR